MITFRKEDHTYWDTRGNEYISVTSLLASEFPFESDKIVEKVQKIHSSRYYGMSTERILKMWGDSSGHGNEIHNAIEKYIKEGKMPEDPRIFPLIEQFSRLNFKGTLQPEVLLWDEKYRIAGIADILECFNNYIYLWDIKTSNRITDDKLMKFSMQLEMYKRLAEKQFNKKVIIGALLWYEDYVVKRSKTKLKIIQPLRCVEVVDDIFKKRLKYLKETTG